MKYIALIIASFICLSAYSQGVNCDAVYEKGTPCYEACKRLYGGSRGDRSDFQGAYESILNLDSILVMCPNFADAYYTKAIPYLKRGEFITWKKLIDKAVELDPVMYLGYRGGARFMFLRDYEGAIEDIENYKKKINWDIGHIYNGDYHLEVIRALSYRGIGNNTKAVDILEDYIKENTEDPGRFTYLHLGVIYLQSGNLPKAELTLLKQISDFDYYADTYYWLAKVYEAMGDKDRYLSNMKKAEDYYLQEKCLPGLDSYMDYPDKIYLQQIREALNL